MQWLAIPNIAILFVTLQALGFLMVMSDPIWVGRLALIPELVLQGEYWRLITFLALPLAMSPIWVLFALLFIYFILNTIEREWGAFKTTLYVLTSILLTIAVSFIFSYPITQVSDFESTLFLAVATLFPEMEIRVYFFIPVKMKWLAWLSLAFLGLKLFQTDWIGRIYLIAIYSNYLIFFGPALLANIKNWIRRENYKRKLR
jgi:membrane associated rhomboid family serine protease